ncbi:hypothetical protein [Pontibacter sp. H249]|uniref:hypothetical protein n=1 Tax=Pontibacter sp. H249 TaxID=3133420 RepID=UPI0030C5A52A
MIRELNWQAVTEQERNKAINELKSMILNSGGYIINSIFFSDLALSLTIEIEEKDIFILHSKFNEFMTISALGLENLNDNSDKQWWIFLNVTFNQGKGNLKVEVPEVPG